MSSQNSTDLATTPNRLPGTFTLLVAGATIGALWGVLARTWMRFITAEPEFSWSGTLTIVGVFAICGAGQALALAARRDDWRGQGYTASQIAALVSALPLGIGAGIMMLPSTLLAAIVIGRRRMKRLARIAFAVLAFIPTLGVLAQLLGELPLWRALVGWGLMFAIYLPIAWVLSWTMQPIGPRDRPFSRPEKAVLALIGVVAVVVVAVMSGLVGFA